MSTRSIVRKVMTFERHRRLVWFGVTATAEHWDSNWSALDIERIIAATRVDPFFLPLVDQYVPRGGKLLEAGCGLGQWVTVLRERGYSSFGLDYVIEALRTAVQNGGGTSVFARGDVRALPFADGTFDAVTSFGVVEHFWNGPTPLLSDMVRVLKPGGVMFVSVPYFNPLRKLRTWRPGPKARIEPPEPPSFYQFAFEKNELLQYLRAAGLTIVETVGMGAVKGLKDELPLVGSVRRSLDAPTVPAVGPASPAPPRPGRTLKARLRGALQALVYSRPVANFAGHMILVVCRKPA